MTFFRNNSYKCVKVFILSALLWSAGYAVEELSSPDGRIVAEFRITDTDGESRVPVYSLSYNGAQIIEDSRLGLSIENAPDFSDGLEIQDSERSSVTGEWSPVYGQWESIPENYNQVSVELKETEAPSRRLLIKLRVYNEGVALCYTIPEQTGMESFTINGESTEFRFTGNHTVYVTDYAQGDYEKTYINSIGSGCERPLTVEVDEHGPFAALAEARMVDYARTKFKEGRTNTIETQIDGNVEAVTPYTTPWRVVMLGDTPSELLNRQYLILNLNKPCKLDNTSWITPGKAIRIMDRSTQGCLDYIEFAEERNLEYVHLDAGWYGLGYSEEHNENSVPTEVIDEIDIQQVTQAAHSSGLKFFVYINHVAMEEYDMENTFSTYKNWGIDGLKFGFVNVGSQYWTEWLHDAVRLAADHELVVDIHDNYCPTGWSRTFPNLMTQEGIKGDESSPSIENTLRILYTRMLAGAADHTYCYYDSRVTSKYSKAFQLAKAVVFYSPVQFLYWYDRPSAYSSGDTEIEFWDSMPTVWDDTKALKGEIGEYATIARKSGEEWYIGSITDDSRVLEIPLDFLDHTKWYMAHMYTTGSSSAEVRIGRYLVHYGVTLRAGLPDNGGQAVRLVPATESDIQEYKNVQGPGWDKDIADWPSGSESGPGNGIHIGILSPDNNTSIMLGTDLEVSVSAEDEDGSIERLELYLNDSLTAQVSLSSNTFTCEGLSAGAYSVEAKAYDDQGNSEAESISVEVYDPDAEPVEFSPTDDAYLESGTGYNDEYLKVEPGTRVTYLKFDVSDFGGAEIAEAHLNLTCSADGGEGLIRVYSGTGSWTEEGINQTDAPSKGDEIASLERQFSEGSEYTLDVSQAFGETGVNTFIIEMESGGNDVWFSSKEGDATPTLILNTSSNTLISEGVKGGATELSIATGRLNISGARGRIRFSLAQESYTELNMYNTRGVLLDRLVSERMGPGLHSAGFNTQSLSSGIYFLTLRNGGKMVTGSVVLIR